jgi:hypothetical protein
MSVMDEHGADAMDYSTNADLAYLGLLMTPFVTMLVVTIGMVLRDAMKPTKRQRRVMRWMDRV